MVCQSEFELAVLKERNEQTCPTCKTRMRPMRIANDGYIKINWEEIRLMAIYAQRWTEKFDKTNQGNMDYIKALNNIVSKIQLYQPKTSMSLDPKEEVPKDASGKITKAILSPYYNENNQ